MPVNKVKSKTFLLTNQRLITLDNFLLSLVVKTQEPTLPHWNFQQNRIPNRNFVSWKSATWSSPRSVKCAPSSSWRSGHQLCLGECSRHRRLSIPHQGHQQLLSVSFCESHSSCFERFRRLLKHSFVYCNVSCRRKTWFFLWNLRQLM